MDTKSRLKEVLLKSVKESTPANSQRICGDNNFQQNATNVQNQSITGNGNIQVAGKVNSQWHNACTNSNRVKT